MGLAEFFSGLLNPVFAPLLKLQPELSIALIAFIITIITTLAYRFMTDQKAMKHMKAEQKEMQKRMREHRHDPKKMMEFNKAAMEKSMKMMTQSFKPMFITILPIMLIFFWLNTHLAYIPIEPGREFTVDVLFNSGAAGDVSVQVPDGVELTGEGVVPIADKKASFSFTGEAGKHNLIFAYESREYRKEVLITTEQAYAPPELKLKDSDIRIIRTNHEKLKVNFLGIRLSWFWAYLIMAIVFSIVLRKLMKVY